MTGDTGALPAEIEALAIAELVKRVKARDSATRALFSQAYPDGQKTTFRSPLDGEMLGYVQRTDPDPTWIVTDPSQVMAHFAETPEAWETIAEVTLPDGDVARMSPDDELARVVKDRIPHIYAEVEELRTSAVDGLMEETRREGKAAAPGIARVKPSGTLRVVPDKDSAGAAIERLVQSGWLTWDGRRALPPGEASA